jgi:carbon monoxide dehydrogenase subunit G
MGIDVTAEARVDRPREEVAAYMTDPANDPDWIGGVQEARLVGDPPLRVGSRVARIAKFLGREVRYVNEVVALDSSTLEMRSVEAPFAMHITYTFDDAGGSTVVRNRVRGEAGRMFWFAGPLLSRMVRRNVQRDLERLRNVLEKR